VKASEKFDLEILNRLTDVSAADWNALVDSDAGPFLKYEFLSALEDTGCVGNNTGWQVAHSADARGHRGHLGGVDRLEPGGHLEGPG
jgi:predicted N-acyltransferase